MPKCENCGAGYDLNSVSRAFGSAFSEKGFCKPRCYTKARCERDDEPTEGTQFRWLTDRIDKLESQVKCLVRDFSNLKGCDCSGDQWNEGRMSKS